MPPGEYEREVPEEFTDDETRDGDETTLSGVPADREPATNGDQVDAGEGEGEGTD